MLKVKTVIKLYLNKFEGCVAVKYLVVLKNIHSNLKCIYLFLLYTYLSINVTAFTIKLQNVLRNIIIAEKLLVKNKYLFFI